MRELTKTFEQLLQDKRVRSEQNKYEAFSRQRSTVLNKYRKVYQAYTDLQAGLLRAQQFYEEMKETVDSMKKNVESFVENRRSEGGQLLGAIEAQKGNGADREQARLKDLMERMSVSPTTHSSHSPVPSAGEQRGSSQSQRPAPLNNKPALYNPARSPPISPNYHSNGVPPSNYQYFQNPTPTNSQFRNDNHAYNPGTYGQMSPAAHQQYFSPPPNHQYQQQPSTTMYGQQQTPQQQQYGGQGMPPGWQPPPPPPGPPPNQNQDYSALQATQYPNGPGGYASNPRRSAPQSSGADPWAGLSAWK